jgi:predicted nucleic acid-binding protein
MRLYLDACAIIYAIEGAVAFQTAALDRIADALGSASGVLVTSRLSLLECRVKPLRDNDPALLGKYDEFFTRTDIELSEITPPIIDRATTLRAIHGLKTPDSIHVATALEAQADVLVTGDAGLRRVPGLRVDVI